MAGFCFRLTFHHPTRGFFSDDDDSQELHFIDGSELKLIPRDAERLSDATRFHFEGGGFLSADEAYSAGNRLRMRLRVLNALLGLGISIPTSDGNSARLSQEIKEKVSKEHNAVLLDSIVGIGVFPDDGNHLEVIVAGRADVHQASPRFVFDSLGKLWPIEMNFDERAEVALEIINHATVEVSPRTQFLLTYFALERLVDRVDRSEAARALIEKFQEQVRNAELSDNEARSLIGALGHLSEQSFGAALLVLVDRIVNPHDIDGKPLRQFLLDCITLRNRLAHSSGLPPGVDLRKVSKGLRGFVMQLIWTRCGLPDISFEVPASKIAMRDGGLTVRVR